MSEILPGDAEVAFLRSEVERLTRERDEVRAELARRNREEGAYRQSVVDALAEAGIPHSTSAEGTDATKIPHGRTMFQAGDRIRLLTRERDEAIRQIGPLAAENTRLRGALESLMARANKAIREHEKSHSAGAPKALYDVRDMASAALNGSRLPAILDDLQGVQVSVDVDRLYGTDGRRLFGTVTVVQEDRGNKHDVILLVQDAEPNWTPAALARSIGTALAGEGE